MLRALMTCMAHAECPLSSGIRLIIRDFSNLVNFVCGNLYCMEFQSDSSVVTAPQYVLDTNISRYIVFISNGRFAMIYISSLVALAVDVVP